MFTDVDTGYMFFVTTNDKVGYYKTIDGCDAWDSVTELSDHPGERRRSEVGRWAFMETLEEELKEELTKGHCDGRQVPSFSFAELLVSRTTWAESISTNQMSPPVSNMIRLPLASHSTLLPVMVKSVSTVLSSMGSEVRSTIIGRPSASLVSPAMNATLVPSGDHLAPLV